MGLKWKLNKSMSLPGETALNFAKRRITDHRCAIITKHTEITAFANAMITNRKSLSQVETSPMIIVLIEKRKSQRKSKLH